MESRIWTITTTYRNRSGDFELVFKESEGFGVQVWNNSSIIISKKIPRGDSYFYGMVMAINVNRWILVEVEYVNEPTS